MSAQSGATARTALKGVDLLNTPLLNHGTAFTLPERAALGLEGLLPTSVETIDRQVDRAKQQLASKPDDLERYIYLNQLADTDETLFYRLVMADPAYFLPILYDPTVGYACLKFGHLYRRPRGMYVSLEHQGRVRQVLENWPVKDVRVICVSTGGRILGLGDLGANGMGIPIGKLQLYTACAAVPQRALLPILLDCGTENEGLLADPLYLGLRQRRPSDDEMTVFVDEFVDAVEQVFPNCCIHFEDWRGTDAVRFLARYQDKVSCFNDDIQGTGSIVVAGLFNALAIKKEKFRDQTVLFFGAGSAGLGNARMIVSAMKLEGLSDEEARRRIWMFDINGLLEPSRTDLLAEQKLYAHPHAPSRDLRAVVESVKPTILIGVSTVGRAFTQPVIETMARASSRPIIFALSNPTEKAECTPAQAYEWTRGQALYAAGVQFPPVMYNGKTYLPGQANNFYVYPAVGLAVYATNTRRVTDEMFITAARAIADQVTDEQRNLGLLFPLQKDVLEAEIRTAEAVAGVIFDRGFARVERPKDINLWLRGLLYRADYAPVA